MTFFQQILKLLQTYSDIYLRGFFGTIRLSVITMCLAVVLGTLVSLAKNGKSRLLKGVINVYIEILRGTPPLLQLYFFWILLPKVLPFELSDTVCILTALIVNASAYVAEVIRAGIQAVDPGQREAALSLGMSERNMMMRIILPQAIRSILPAMGNEFINIIKGTSLASVFFINELTTSYRTVQSATFLALPSIMIAGMIYLVLNYVLSRGVAAVERRLAVD
ncbi:MAG: amino acid ABC transporter permease [Solobacterium sp.]|nr:amino acid ABC transporter permease [Solobacterium sp.]